MRESLVTYCHVKDLNNSHIKHYIKEWTQKSINSILNSKRKGISFEICPNRHLDWDLLADFCPDFCSVTWLGKEANRLQSMYCEEIPAILLAKELCSQGNNVVLHLAGRNLCRLNALRIIETAKQIGIRNLFLIQGDRSLAPDNCDMKSDFPYAENLVSFIRYHYESNFHIGVAGYPQKHPLASTIHSDINQLRSKVSSGADFIITQASFDFQALKEFSHICNQRGIHVPIVAGFYIISSYKTFKSMVTFCEITVPEHVMNILETHKHSEETIKEYGLHLSITLMRQILNDKDFSGIHLFTLNNLTVLKPVLKALGLYGIKIERPL